MEKAYQPTVKFLVWKKINVVSYVNHNETSKGCVKTRIGTIIFQWVRYATVITVINGLRISGWICWHLYLIQSWIVAIAGGPGYWAVFFMYLLFNKGAAQGLWQVSTSTCE